MNNILGSLINSKVNSPSHYKDLGIKIGKLYTDMGYPVDMSLDGLDYTKEDKIAILDGVCQWLIEHKRNSGASDKAIERQRKANTKMVENFIKKGETGVY